METMDDKPQRISLITTNEDTGDYYFSKSYRVRRFIKLKERIFRFAFNVRNYGYIIDVVFFLIIFGVKLALPRRHGGLLLIILASDNEAAKGMDKYSEIALELFIVIIVLSFILMLTGWLLLIGNNKIVDGFN